MIKLRRFESVLVGDGMDGFVAFFAADLCVAMTRAYEFLVFVLDLPPCGEPAYGSVIADSSHPLR